MSYDDEYYILEPDLKYALIDVDWDNEPDGVDLSDIYLHEPVYYSDPIPFIFNEESEHLKYADFHVAPRLVFHNKIVDELLSLEIYKTQYLPAQIKDLKGNIKSEYFYWHIYNYIKCVDLDRSDYKVTRRKGLRLNSFSLAESVLNSIKIENRLVFRLDENKSKIIIHENIVKRLKSHELTGIRYYTVKEWDTGAMFR